jgi:hypothetical protein
MTVSPVPLLHLRELDIQTRFLTPRVIDGDIEDVVRTLSNVPRLTLGRLLIGCRGAEGVAVRLLRRVHSDSFILQVTIQIL